MTLETNNYQEISFQSTQVQPSGADRWKVEGNLTLRGATKLITLVVKRSNNAYTGQRR
jgi:polyisoprenoid-binding protein YceI